LGKNSKYLRDLTRKQIEDINKKYEKYLKDVNPQRNGFLTNSQKNLLLRKKNLEQNKAQNTNSDNFSQIREKTRSALVDFQLLFDTMSENQLKVLFGNEDEQTPRNPKLMYGSYPLSILFESLLPKVNDKNNESTQWKKYFMEEIIVMGLLWYYNSGIVMTSAQKEMLLDTIDAITIATSGKKKIEKNTFSGFSYTR
jgi:hypothetical protein